MNYILECAKISKSFDHVILKDVNFVVMTPGIFLIKGVSGSGKSTFLDICGLIKSPDRGDVFINNKKANTFSTKIKQEIIGYCFQNSRFLPELNVLENALIKLYIKNSGNALHIYELLNYFNLNPHEKIENLSGGQKQRLSIIRAMSTNPQILILDEPFNSLDQDNILKTSTLLNSIKKNTAIIISSHINTNVLSVDISYEIKSYNIHND